MFYLIQKANILAILTSIYLSIKFEIIKLIMIFILNKFFNKDGEVLQIKVFRL